MQAWAENRAAAAALCSYHLRGVSNGSLHGADSGLNASNQMEGLEDLPAPGWGNPPSAFYRSDAQGDEGPFSFNRGSCDRSSLSR